MQIPWNTCCKILGSCCVWGEQMLTDADNVRELPFYSERKCIDHATGILLKRKVTKIKQDLRLAKCINRLNRTALVEVKGLGVERRKN